MNPHFGHSYFVECSLHCLHLPIISSPHCGHSNIEYPTSTRPMPHEVHVSFVFILTTLWLFIKYTYLTFIYLFNYRTLYQKYIINYSNSLPIIDIYVINHKSRRIHEPVADIQKGTSCIWKNRINYIIMPNKRFLA